MALVCHGHSRPIVDINFSPVTDDGYFLVSASKDGKPMLRNGETGDWIGTFEGHKGAVWAAKLNKPALLTLTASADFTARVWDALTGDELHLFQHKHIVRTCHFSENLTKVMTGGMEKIVRIFDLNRPEADAFCLNGSPSGIRCGLFAMEDTVLFTACASDSGIRLWDPRGGNVVRELETTAPVTDISVTPCGRFLCTCDDSTVRIWETSDFRQVKAHTMDFPIEGASYDPTVGKLAMGGADMWVRLFDFDTMAELACHKGHHGPVHCVRFAPNGDAFASGSEDGTIRIYATTEALSTDGDNAAAATTTTTKNDAAADAVEALHISSDSPSPPVAPSQPVVEA